MYTQPHSQGMLYMPGVLRLRLPDRQNESCPASTFLLPWPRFFRDFSSVVRQMPGYISKIGARPASPPPQTWKLHQSAWTSSHPLVMTTPFWVRIPESHPTKVIIDFHSAEPSTWATMCSPHFTIEVTEAGTLPCLSLKCFHLWLWQIMDQNNTENSMIMWLMKQASPH
jgi:hypothetical protein